MHRFTVLCCDWALGREHRRVGNKVGCLLYADAQVHGRDGQAISAPQGPLILEGDRNV